MQRVTHEALGSPWERVEAPAHEAFISLDSDPEHSSSYTDTRSPPQLQYEPEPELKSPAHSYARRAEVSRLAPVSTSRHGQSASRHDDFSGLPLRRHSNVGHVLRRISAGGWRDAGVPACRPGFPVQPVRSRRPFYIGGASGPWGSQQRAVIHSRRLRTTPPRRRPPVAGENGEVQRHGLSRRRRPGRPLTRIRPVSARPAGCIPPRTLVFAGRPAAVRDRPADRVSPADSDLAIASVAAVPKTTSLTLSSVPFNLPPRLSQTPHPITPPPPHHPTPSTPFPKNVTASSGSSHPISKPFNPQPLQHVQEPSPRPRPQRRRPIALIPPCNRPRTAVRARSAPRAPRGMLHRRVHGRDRHDAMNMHPPPCPSRRLPCSGRSSPCVSGPKAEDGVEESRMPRYMRAG